ncbi:hypothetical protein SNL152K_751 [Streptomyces sp. NL15-2K]|nr:hypothetical protein SNL152K_751 [Streptomyces sp. NL15-2K]
MTAVPHRRGDAAARGRGGVMEQCLSVAGDEGREAEESLGGPSSLSRSP